jgi:hypothetical protein
MTRTLPTKNPLLDPRIGHYIYQLFRISITFSRRDHQADSGQRYFTKNPNWGKREGALIQPNHIKRLNCLVQTEHKTEV